MGEGGIQKGQKPCLLSTKRALCVPEPCYLVCVARLASRAGFLGLCLGTGLALCT
jgi:hypothetical protein